ncbi:hypothetical protein Salat_1536400 [Sesamum alatum]|uniref:Ankyrin repeat family protein n=1 Tax=Sesamum alatum TaxID=300844 RepID=A0AAE1YCF2_9LAMI|nr:hypothetical protein Salat_1536400 [Sesamum alatum]
MGEPETTTLIQPSPPSTSPSRSCIPDESWSNLKTRRKLPKHLSIKEVPRNIAWERRRRQILQQERRKNSIAVQDAGDDDHLTDEDLKELKGCIELGFGFNEEEGRQLCPTLPALDLYFAVNRQFLTSPLASPASTGPALSPAISPGGRYGCGSPTGDLDSWKIVSPGDDPQHAKKKLRHWAQAVACSVRQCAFKG